MEIGDKKKAIISFQDLDVYQRRYGLMLKVFEELLPQLPQEEKYDLKDQIRRSSKAAPALLAEGFAKRYQMRSWRKYIEDTIGEVNEMIHHISVCRDVYSKYVNHSLCKELIQGYDIANKQLYRLSKSWQNFNDNK